MEKQTLKELTVSNGLRMICPPNVRGALMFREIYEQEIYWPKDTFEIHGEDIVVDIGANVGFFCCTVGYMVPDARIIAYEPAEDNFQALKQNLIINDIKNVVAVNSAVAKSKTKAKRTLYRHPYGEVHSLYEGEKNFGEEEVTAISFNDLREVHKLQRIDYLKIDVEGAEYEILEDANLEGVRRIAVEAHPLHHGFEPMNLTLNLERRGFKVWAAGHLDNNLMIYGMKR